MTEQERKGSWYHAISREPGGTVEERAYRAGQRDAAAERGLYFCGPADTTAAYLAGARSVVPFVGTIVPPAGTEL